MVENENEAETVQRAACGVERRRDAKVASFAEGESHGLTVCVLRYKWRDETRSSARAEKIVVNLKQSVSTRAVLPGYRKQFNIRSYGACDGKEDTHEHEFTYLFSYFGTTLVGYSFHCASFTVNFLRIRKFAFNVIGSERN